MDEEQNPQPQPPAQNDESQAPAPEATPAPETVEQQPTPDEGEATPYESEQEAPAQPKPSPRAERRIHQLNERLRQASQQNQQRPPGQPPQMPQYNPGDEVTPERLQADVVQAASAIADAQVQHRFQQYDAQNNLSRDTETLPSKYEELNPDNASYTPELEESIVQEYQDRAFRVIGYNPQTGEPITQLDPSVRLADIAERQIKSARAYAAKTAERTSHSIARAADEAAPQMNAPAQPERNFADLSIEEMEQRLGYGPQR